MANPKLKFYFRKPTIDTNLPINDGRVKGAGRRENRFVRWFLFIALCVIASARQSSSATVEENLAVLNGKPAEERQKILIENARKEGSVTFYAATNMRDTQEIVAGFNKFYPIRQSRNHQSRRPRRCEQSDH